MNWDTIRQQVGKDRLDTARESLSESRELTPPLKEHDKQVGNLLMEICKQLRNANLTNLDRMTEMLRVVEDVPSGEAYMYATFFMDDDPQNCMDVFCDIFVSHFLSTNGAVREAAEESTTLTFLNRQLVNKLALHALDKTMPNSFVDAIFSSCDEIPLEVLKAIIRKYQTEPDLSAATIYALMVRKHEFDEQFLRDTLKVVKAHPDIYEYLGLN